MRSKDAVKEYLTEADGSPLYLSDAMKGILKDASVITKKQLELQIPINKASWFPGDE